MAGLVRPGGLLAVRDADYPAMTGAPDSAGLDRWLEVYLAVTQRNGAEAAAARHLPAWARAAGLARTTFTTSTWTFATPDDRRWWAGMWAERIVSSSVADQAIAYGLATAGELADIAAAWHAWADEPGGVFVILNGELLARP
jgi:hypothetical protein